MIGGVGEVLRGSLVLGEASEGEASVGASERSGTKL
jgi:hypothetical protein